MIKEKIVLAYSGGLDTSAIIPWLKENYNYDVYALCIDIGQGAELENLEKRGYECGAGYVKIERATDELVNDYIFPMLKSGAMYENKYLLGTSIARPLIAKKLVEYAREVGASAICHGATGKGNDQVRFDLGIWALAPEMKIIAPWRIWNIKSREDAVEYCIKHDIKLNLPANQLYSRDKNIWHLSHEGLELENPDTAPDYENLLMMCATPENAPDEAEIITIDFEKGIPVKLNDKDINGTDLIYKLNEIGGKHGVGVIDMVENRVVGMKSRGIYETPGGTILYYAHNELERICLDRQTYSFKATAAVTFAELVYNGMWFTPLREAISAFIDKTQENVTGKVKLKLYKGNIIPQGVSSPYTLYNEEISSFTTGNLYDHKDAEGFIKLYGLPLRVRASMIEKNKG
ncbi:MAG: argininosuccinate synthase [Eubacteriaceae bacterium]|nr:argininosuccinate synthase [Eubacteriaceae bacterium]